LNLSFIYAWKSGTNPSTNKLTNKNISPNTYVLVFEFELEAGSNTLNIMIPIVTKTAITIFLGPNFNYLLLTLEQNTPTKITLSKEQDLAITIKGNVTK
jgi:hypothetical protein